MFDVSSRYYSVEDAYFRPPDSKSIIKYKKRRLIEETKENDIVLTEFNIASGDRIDLLSFKYFGNPELFWRLCDMNEIMHPLDLTHEIGKTVKIIGEN